MNTEDVQTEKPVRKIIPPNPRPKWIPEGGLKCLGPGCGKPIPAGWYGSRRKNYFCCGHCEGQYFLSQRPLVRCTWCKRLFQRKHRGNNKPICSKECFKAWRRAPLDNRVGHFKPLLDGLVDTYFQDSEASRHEIRSNVGMLLTFLRRKQIRSMNSVRFDHITAFLKELRQKGWTQTANMVSSIKLFFDWTIMTGKRKYANPVVRQFHDPRRPKRLPRPYSPEELTAIGKLLEQSADPALKAAVAIGQAAGLRISEVARLKIDHVNLEKQEILVVTPNKTNYEHTVPFTTEAKERIMAWLTARGTHDHNFLFVGPSGKPMSKDTLRKRLKRVLCGDGKLSGFSFHRLRGYVATTLAKNKSDVLSIAKTIGWQDVKSAQAYIELDTTDLHESYHRTMEKRAQSKASRPTIQSLDEFFTSKNGGKGKS